MHESSRRVPGHIHTDLLTRIQNPPNCCRFLSISFFTSIEEMLRRTVGRDAQVFAHWLQERTKQSIHLGTFSLQLKSEVEIPSVMTVVPSSGDSALREIPQ